MDPGIICKYKTDRGKCLILSELSGRNYYVSDKYCATKCRPDNPDRGYLLSTIKPVGAGKARRQAIDAAVDELPGALSMIRNLGKHALTVVDHYKKTGRVFVNGTQQAERLKICEACEHYTLDDRGSPRCKQASCGCHLSGEIGKTRFEALPCPIGKHDALDKTYRED